MVAIEWAYIPYFTFIMSYLLNVLVTELPADDRYEKLKSHFSLKKFVSLTYFPIYYWFSSSFLSLPKPLKVRHLFVLVISIVLFITHFFGYTLLNPFLHFLIFSMITICFFTDLECHIIPNEISLGLTFVGILHAFYHSSMINSLKGMGIAIMVFSIFALIMLLFGQSHAFGAGDIKLCLGIGAIWGWQVTVIMLYFTFLIGGFVGLYFLVIKRKPKTTYYAFAPVIILGLIMALFWTNSIFDYYYPWVNNTFIIEINQPKQMPRL